MTANLLKNPYHLQTPYRFPKRERKPVYEKKNQLELSSWTLEE